MNRHLKENSHTDTHGVLEVYRNKFTPIKPKAVAENSAFSS